MSAQDDLAPLRAAAGEITHGIEMLRHWRGNAEAQGAWLLHIEKHASGLPERVARVESRLAHLEEGLRRIKETAEWYAKNDQRLAHEVDHALCVEVLDAAERSLLADQDGAA